MGHDINGVFRRLKEVFDGWRVAPVSQTYSQTRRVVVAFRNGKCFIVNR